MFLGGSEGPQSPQRSSQGSESLPNLHPTSSAPQQIRCDLSSASPLPSLATTWTDSPVRVRMYVHSTITSVISIITIAIIIIIFIHITIIIIITIVIIIIIISIIISIIVILLLLLLLVRASHTVQH